MLSFACDYTQGAHEAILRRLIETNMVIQPGYGDDEYTLAAAEKIRAACQCPHAQIKLLVGGTQTNQVTIASMLRSYDGVISATTGHVNGHEAGAIEYSGHKVIALPHHNGKLCADEVRRYLQVYYADETELHMVRPAMVYISHPTEYGTLYSLSELEALHQVCNDYSIPLYMDGARLGYGLMSYETDVTLPDIARLCDVFYIGGTKVGALCGEALVFTKNNMPDRMLSIIKQHGALAAKGRLLGVQFDTLFTDGLYFKISRHAIDMAKLLVKTFKDRGYETYIDSPTNQQFIILTRSQMERLAKDVAFSTWEWLDEDRAVVRFATSWGTTEEEIAALAALL